MPALRSASYKGGYDKEKAKFPGLLKKITECKRIQKLHTMNSFFFKNGSSRKQGMMVSIHRAKPSTEEEIFKERHEKITLLKSFP